MAVGPYTSINENQLDKLLKSYNSVIGSGVAGSLGFQVLTDVNAKLFPLGTGTIHYDSDTTTAGAGGTAVSPTHALYFEYGTSTSTSPLNFTPVHSEVVVLGGESSTYFNDLGATTDHGDVIVGANANQYIQVNQGNNIVVAGSEYDTLVGGAGKDVLIGGGKTSIQAGSGNQSLFGGLNRFAHDTLVGGSGKDYISVAAGNNTIIAGSGSDSIYSGDRGYGDNIFLTSGGDAKVTIGSGSATDTVTFGGTAGNDTILAHGNVDIEIQHGETLSGIDSKNGVTTLTFAGQTLTYAGAGHVTVTFH